MKKKEWFASWFDTEFYHILYQKRDDAEAVRFISNLVDDLELSTGTKVLDLACGKGRHSRTLHSLNLDVLGVDLSENSIQCASNDAPDGLRFAVQDMRFPMDEQFEVIFNLFTSFGYFDDLNDNHKVIQSVHTMLQPDGIVVIDFMNSFKVIHSLVEREEKVLNDIRFHIERRYDGTHIFKDIRFEHDGLDHHFTERVQALMLDDFKQLLQTNGFNILRTFGDFDLNSFRKEDSDRLIIIAQKTS